jgi:gluconokinase
LEWLFTDADDLHPKRNLEKLKSGFALTDLDRRPWLEKAESVVEKIKKDKTNAVFAFPGLTEQHRKKVLGSCSDIEIVHLTGSFKLIKERLRKRENHFFPVELLHTQFDILEPPIDVLSLDVTPPPKHITKAIRRGLNV